MIVGPRAKLERAVLLVEREIADFDFTGRLVDGRREPGHLTVVGDHGIGVEGDLIGPISTDDVTRRNKEIYILNVYITKTFI